MPNTKIQLRGISRVPSDRLVADGECAESLNVIMHESETAPMARPKDVTEDLAPGLSEAGIDVLYIHQTATYTNYIGISEYEGDIYLSAYKKSDGDAWELVRIVEVAEMPSGFSSVGNVLVYSVESGMRYAIYKDGTYEDLGAGIPRPTVHFETTPQPQEIEVKTLADLGAYVPAYQAYEREISSSPTPLELWSYVISRRHDADANGEIAANFYNVVRNNIWDTISSLRVKLREDDLFTAPVFARYALRLFDGSYIYASEPILLSGGTGKYFEEIANQSVLYFFQQISLAQCFALQVTIGYDGASKWQDLVESVDIFLSTDILSPEFDSELTEATQLDTTMTVPGATITNNDIRIEVDSDKDFEAVMLEKVNFYKVASYTLDELPTGETISPLSQDGLVVLPRLDEDTEAHLVSGAGALGSYNMRLVTGAQQVTLSPGHCEPQAMVGGATGNTETWAMVYYVRDAEGKTHTVYGYQGDFIDASVQAYVAYPDAWCVGAELYKYESGQYSTYLSIPMRAHPRLNCAYGFWGLGTTLFQMDPAGDHRRKINTNASGELPAEDPVYEIDNRLALSQVDNPFVFPVDQRQKFSAKIIQAVPATIALSANQSDPLPIYVFTEDGIWAESITIEGGLARNNVVSRDVAIDGTIAQLDRAIVFTSKQGVMLLQGGKVANLSLSMNGRNFVPSDELIDTIQSFSPDSVIVDSVPFQTFVSGAKPAYDYAGNRIIFFNPKHPTFQYVLALANQTWHRIKLPLGDPRSFHVLNSYPDCLVFFGDDTINSGGEIVDFSTLLNADADEDALPGLIVTRDINFGGNDVYKTIKRVAIRGDRFPEEDPWKYVLLGSNDRKNYHVLHSLRGPSWKFYRIAIATTMQQGGRISYIELDWEPRFTDRIR